MLDECEEVAPDGRGVGGEGYLFEGREVGEGEGFEADAVGLRGWEWSLSYCPVTKVFGANKRDHRAICEAKRRVM